MHDEINVESTEMVRGNAGACPITDAAEASSDGDALCIYLFQTLERDFISSYYFAAKCFQRALPGVLPVWQGTSPVHKVRLTNKSHP